jgi:hypothetical protein
LRFFQYEAFSLQDAQVSRNKGDIIINLQEKTLYHQIQPAKLVTDISASITSTVLFWDRFFWAGILANLVPLTKAG